jgi:hypothetical protein
MIALPIIFFQNCITTIIAFDYSPIKWMHCVRPITHAPDAFGPALAAAQPPLYVCTYPG